MQRIVHAIRGWVGCALLTGAVFEGSLGAQTDREALLSEVPIRMVAEWSSCAEWQPLISPLVDTHRNALSIGTSDVPPECDPLLTLITALGPKTQTIGRMRGLRRKKLNMIVDRLANWELPTVKLWLIRCPATATQNFANAIIPPEATADLIERYASHRDTISAKLRLGSVQILGQQTPHQVSIRYAKVWSGVRSYLRPARGNSYTGIRAQVCVVPSVHGGHFYQLRLERSWGLGIRMVDTGLPLGATDLPYRSEVHLQSSGRIPPASGVVLSTGLGPQATCWVLAITKNPLAAILSQHPPYLPAGEFLALHFADSAFKDEIHLISHSPLIWNELEGGERPFSLHAKSGQVEQRLSATEPGTHAQVDDVVLRSIGLIRAPVCGQLRDQVRRELQGRASEYAPTYRIQWSCNPITRAGGESHHAPGQLLARSHDLFVAGAADRIQHLLAAEITRSPSMPPAPDLYSRDAYCGSLITGRLQPLPDDQVLIDGTWFVQRPLGEPVLRESGVEGLANIEHWNLSQTRHDGQWALPLNQWTQVCEHPKHSLWLKVSRMP